MILEVAASEFVDFEIGLIFNRARGGEGRGWKRNESALHRYNSPVIARFLSHPLFPLNPRFLEEAITRTFFIINRMIHGRYRGVKFNIFSEWQGLCSGGQPRAEWPRVETWQLEIRIGRGGKELIVRLHKIPSNLLISFSSPLDPRGGRSRREKTKRIIPSIFPCN